MIVSGVATSFSGTNANIGGTAAGWYGVSGASYSVTGGTVVFQGGGNGAANAIYSSLGEDYKVYAGTGEGYAPYEPSPTEETFTKNTYVLIKAVRSYTLTLVNVRGASSATHLEGESLSYTAADAPDKQHFDHWELKVGSDAATNVGTNTTYTGTMPSGNATLTAVYAHCSGGTATCKDKAVCDYCGKPYGEVNKTNHTGGTEIRNSKAATCTEDGYTGDTYCKGCGTKLSDGRTVTKNGHDYESKVTKEPTTTSTGTRTYTCKTCGHSYEEDIAKLPSQCTSHSGGTATCKDPAVCENCGESYGEVNRSNHTGGTEIRNVKNATCTEDGYTGDTYCKGCGTKLSDGRTVTKLGHTDADKNHVCDRESCKATISSCSGGTATCKNKAVCDYCGKPYGNVDSSNHTGETEIREVREATCTEDGYTGDTCCKGCNTRLATGTVIPAGHTDTNKDHICDAETCKATISSCSGGTATCKDKAICDYCGKTYGNVDGSNHTGETEIREVREATCTEDGYTGDTYCKGCEAKLSDGSAVAKTGHAYESKVTKEPTTTSTGTRTYTCKNCGHSYEEEIARLPEESKVPKTGDGSQMMLWLALLLLSSTALAAAVACGRKKRFTAR